jgi:hypothetical protein
MEKSRNLRVSEAVWVRLKQKALDERVTVREVTERAVHQYLGTVQTADQIQRAAAMHSSRSDLKYEPD